MPPALFFFVSSVSGCCKNPFGRASDSTRHKMKPEGWPGRQAYKAGRPTKKAGLQCSKACLLCFVNTYFILCSLLVLSLPNGLFTKWYTFTHLLFLDIYDFLSFLFIFNIFPPNFNIGTALDCVMWLFLSNMEMELKPRKEWIVLELMSLWFIFKPEWYLHWWSFLLEKILRNC